MFQRYIERSLSPDTFDVTKEWVLDVPLDIQILLESFITTRSFHLSKQKALFLQEKLERLYGAYDVLLNTANRKHIGVIQRKNTDQLLVNYHSINNVFMITGRFGATYSMSAADQRLKNRAILDKCYYGTFIKTYPLEYETDAGTSTYMVNLQQCHIILMLDNLVRLQFHADPTPGESRSGQICTLPITLQGLPKDNKVIESWHNEAICDGTEFCKCKQSITLTRCDGTRVFKQLSSDEDKAHTDFSQLSQWGITQQWKTICSSK